MARAYFVKKARHDIWAQGKEVKRQNKKGETVERYDTSQRGGKDDELLVKKGESYYWWKFRFGDKHISKDRPRRSQLTQSAFYGTLYDLEDNLAKQFAEFDGDDAGELVSALEEAAGEVENLGSECEEKVSNMPDSLQSAPTGQLLQDRKDRCDELSQVLNDLASELQSSEPDEADEPEKSDLDLPDNATEAEVEAAMEEKRQELQDEKKGECRHHAVSHTAGPRRAHQALPGVELALTADQLLAAAAAVLQPNLLILVVHNCSFVRVRCAPPFSVLAYLAVSNKIPSAVTSTCFGLNTRASFKKNLLEAVA